MYIYSQKKKQFLFAKKNVRERLFKKKSHVLRRKILPQNWFAVELKKRKNLFTQAYIYIYIILERRFARTQ